MLITNLLNKFVLFDKKDIWKWDNKTDKWVTNLKSLLIKRWGNKVIV